MHKQSTHNLYIMLTDDKTSPFLFEGNYTGEIQLEYLPCINYAMIHNHIAAFKFCTVKNMDNKDWKIIKLSINGEYIKSAESIIEIIQIGQTLQVKTLELSVDANKLIGLTEGINTLFKLTITIDKYLVDRKSVV